MLTYSSSVPGLSEARVCTWPYFHTPVDLYSAPSRLTPFNFLLRATVPPSLFSHPFSHPLDGTLPTVSPPLTSLCIHATVATAARGYAAETLWSTRNTTSLLPSSIIVKMQEVVFLLRIASEELNFRTHLRNG